MEKQEESYIVSRIVFFSVKLAHAESTFIYLVFTAKCFHSVNEE